MIDFLKYRIFAPIMATDKYEKSIAMQENNCKKIGEILNSEEYERFIKLKQYVESGQCKNEIDTIKSQQFKNSTEYHLEKKLNRFAKSKYVKEFIAKGVNQDSFEVTEYLNVKQTCESNEFREKKAYLCDTAKYKKCSAYKALKEYNYLKKSDAIKMLPKLQNACKTYVTEMSKWKNTFFDDFDSVILEKKWITQPATTLRHFRESYTQLGDLHFISDGKNINVTNSILQIITRHEQADGFLWTPTYGFIPERFSYTSGIINSATKFMQTYGRIEAKVRTPKTKGTYHAVWLGCEQMMPFINVFCINNGKIQIGASNGMQTITKKLSIPLKNDFYVVGIEWNESEIIWKINGKKVFSAPIRINEQLHLAFSSGVKTEQNASTLPISFDIDWVKCYKYK